MTRQVVDWPVADRTWAFRRLPAMGTAASGPVMSAGSPRNVIVAKRTRAPFAAHGESLPIGRQHRSVDRPDSKPLRACLYVSLSRGNERGIVRDREGT